MIPIEALAAAPLHAALALAQAALPDTIVTVQAGAQGFQRVIDVLQSIASVVIALALIAIAIPLIPAAWNSRKMYARINSLIERFRSDIDPIVKHSVTVADNLNYVTTSVRADVQKLSETVLASNRRLNRAAALAEERIAELNALLQVVQEEAESLFIDTASTVRGIQVGADAFRRFRLPEAVEDGLYDDDVLLDEELADPYEEDDEIDPIARGRREP